MRARVVAVLFGGLFGFLLTWGQFEDPARIREMLLLEDPYLYLMMASAIAVGTAGIWVLRRRRARSPLTGEPIALERSRPRRRHIAGAATFGLGWAITASCPAPIASQLAQGVGWSLFTIAGVFLGIELYLRGRRTAPAPARVVRRAAEPSAAPESA
ncbi:MAG TPA: DUF6691 family protein [Solirubrobacterales bacterium]